MNPVCVLWAIPGLVPQWRSIINIIWTWGSTQENWRKKKQKWYIHSLSHPLSHGGGPHMWAPCGSYTPCEKGVAESGWEGVYISLLKKKSLIIEKKELDHDGRRGKDNWIKGTKDKMMCEEMESKKKKMKCRSKKGKRRGATLADFGSKTKTKINKFGRLIFVFSYSHFWILSVRLSKLKTH